MQPGRAVTDERSWTQDPTPQLDAGGDGAAARAEQRKFEACDCVLDLAAAFFNVSVRELRRPGRATDDVTRVRQIAMYLAHVMLGLSMGDIGKAFGRDRTTVMHACHLVEDMRDDIELDAIIGRVEKLVAAALSGHRLYWRGGRSGR